MVTVKVPATTANLGVGFDVLGLSLELYNYIEMDLLESGLEITVQGEGEKELSRSEDNLVFRIAQEVFRRNGFVWNGLKISLVNYIPLERGLGSSAATLVGGALAANALSGDLLSEEEILELVIEWEGHPDNVASTLYGGLVCCTQIRGETLWRKIDIDPQKFNFVAVIPDYTISTRAAREVLPEQVPFGDAVHNLTQVGLLIIAFKDGDVSLLSKVMDDRLHQIYRSQLLPGFEKILAHAWEKGIPVALSGAGPTIMAIVPGGEQGTKTYRNRTDFIGDILSEHGIASSSKLLIPDNQGATITNLDSSNF